MASLGCPWRTWVRRSSRWRLQPVPSSVVRPGRFPASRSAWRPLGASTVQPNSSAMDRIVATATVRIQPRQSAHEHYASGQYGSRPIVRPGRPITDGDASNGIGDVHVCADWAGGLDYDGRGHRVEWRDPRRTWPPVARQARSVPAGSPIAVATRALDRPARRAHA